MNTILTGRMVWTCSPKYNSGVACYSICPGNNAQVSESCRVGSIDSPENDCYLVPIPIVERDWSKGFEKKPSRRSVIGRYWPSQRVHSASASGMPADLLLLIV